MSAPYAITATGAADSDYAISYVGGTLTVTTAALDDHGDEQDQGLRRGAADTHGVVLGLRQWRHLGQPDDPADADDDGHRRVAMSRATPTRSRPAARWIPITRSHMWPGR